MKYKFQNPFHRWQACDECGRRSWDFRWPVTKRTPTPQQKLMMEMTKGVLDISAHKYLAFEVEREFQQELPEGTTIKIRSIRG